MRIIAALATVLVLVVGPVAPDYEVKAQSVPSDAGSPSYDGYLSQARALTAKKQFAAAVSSAELAIRLDDRRWEGFVAAAKAYAAQGLLDDAIGMLQLALSRAPQDRKGPIREAIVVCREQVAAYAATRVAAKGAARVSPPAPAEATTRVQTPPTRGKTQPAARRFKIAPSTLGYVNVRKAPNSSSPIVGRVRPGDTYELGEVRDGWYYVASLKGWIAGKYVIK
jgi:tetratricopeptide (TPR) repeat protein